MNIINKYVIYFCLGLLPVVAGAATFDTVVKVTPDSGGMSSDGSQISTFSGSSIRSTDGVWSFGTADPDGVNAPILLNGASAQGFHGYVIAVANGGQLYVRGSTVWWVWQGGQFVQTSQPTLQALPVALQLSSPIATVLDNSPAGTTLATANVVMSQDGAPFVGRLTTGDASLFTVSGMNIVLARGLTVADDGTRTTKITAR